MTSTPQRLTSVIALLLIFCTSQIYVSAGFAAPDVATGVGESQLLPAQDAVGILTTIGNKPISVNGAASITGTSILSGASIETPEGVGASVNLGKLGSLEIEPNAKLTLNFRFDNIKVILLQGCVTLYANKGITGEIETSKDAVSKTDPTKDGVLRVCHPDSAKLAAAPAVVGLGKLVWLAIFGGPAAVIVPVVTPGDNPSASNPTLL